MAIGTASAVGGALGFAAVAVVGLPATFVLTIYGGDPYVGLSLVACLLPVGAGVGALAAHALMHGEQSLGAVAGGFLGAIAGGLLGMGGGVLVAPAAAQTPAEASALLFGGLGIGLGGLVGAAVGPMIHAAVE